MAKKEEVEEHELKITRTVVPVYVEPNVVREQYVISFYSDKISPQFIYIWKDEWTEDKEKELIAKKIKEALATKTETVKVIIKK